MSRSDGTKAERQEVMDGLSKISINPTFEQRCSHYRKKLSDQMLVVCGQW